MIEMTGRGSFFRPFLECDGEAAEQNEAAA